LQPLAELLCETRSALVLQHVTCTFWGLVQEPPYRPRVAELPRVISRMVELLHSTRNSSDEIQKFAAATLVTLAQDERARVRMLHVDATGALKMLKLVADSWLCSQADELLMLLGAADGGAASSPAAGGKAQPFNKPPLPGTPRLELRYQHTPRPMLEWSAPIVPMPMSPRSLTTGGGRVMSSHTGASEKLLEKFQAKLAEHPDLWMLKDRKDSGIHDEYQGELAIKFRLKDRVLVETESKGVRPATVEFVGKVPEIAPGFWVGVQFDQPEGKNDGTINGTRYFNCEMDHGSFLRPSHLKHNEEEEDALAAQKPAADNTMWGKARAALSGGAIGDAAEAPTSPPEESPTPSLWSKAKAAITDGTGSLDAPVPTGDAPVPTGEGPPPAPTPKSESKKSKPAEKAAEKAAEKPSIKPLPKEKATRTPTARMGTDRGQGSNRAPSAAPAPGTPKSPKASPKASPKGGPLRQAVEGSEKSSEKPKKSGRKSKR